MGFTAGSSLNVGATVTHTQWNSYYGAAGSIDYLKTEADKVDDVSMSADVVGSRALATVYQNTSGKVMVVSVSGHAAASTSPRIQAYVEVGDNTPDVQVASVELDNNTADCSDGSLTFVVPPTAYYMVTSSTGGDITLRNWFEWGLF